jgi:WD40 repeat protein
MSEFCTSTDRIFDLAFSPDDQYLLVSNWRFTVDEPFKARMWEVTTGEVIRDFNYQVDRVIFSPNGNFVAIGNGLDTWLLSTQNEELEYKFSNDEISPIGTNYLFTQDSKFFVIDYADGVTVWDVDLGQTLRSFPNRSDWQMHQEVDVSSDGKNILTYDLVKEETYLYDFHTGNLLFTFKETFSAMFSPNNRYIVTNGREGLKLWDVETLEVVHVLSSIFERIAEVQFSTDSSYLFVFMSSRLTLWDVESGRLLIEVLGTGSGGIYGILPNNQNLLIPEPEGETPHNLINLWDIPLGTKSRNFKLEEGNVDTFAFTQDSRYMAIALNNNVQLWDISEGQKVRSFC